MGTMGNVSRPLLALLVATVAFFALWLVALKGGSSSSSSAPRITGSGTSASISTGSSGGSLGSYQSDINAAKNVQSQVNANTARQGAAEAGSSSTTPAASSASSAPASSASRRSKTSGSASASRAGTTTHHHAKHAAAPTTHARAAHHRHVVVQPNGPATAAARLNAVARALAADKVVALLFYNPAGPDDDAVKAELSTIPTHRGRVVKVAIPLSELPNYATLTAQVPVNFSPTLVIINGHHQATSITGFADTLEIAQRIADAL
jgi:hypothetical protein